MQNPFVWMSLTFLPRFWWLTEVTLVVAFGLCPKFWGGKDLWMTVLLENECSFNGRDNHRWWKYSTPTSSLKKILNFMHSQVMGTQKLWVQAPTKLRATSWNFHHLIFHKRAVRSLLECFLVHNSLRNHWNKNPFIYQSLVQFIIYTLNKQRIVT